MSETQEAPAHSSADPRPGFFKAVTLAGQVIGDVQPNQYDTATPCPDFSVRQLSRHLISVLRRVTVSGTGGNPFTVDSFADVPDEDWLKAWEAAVRDATDAWSDPAILGKTCDLGFVQLPGAAAIVVYTTEITLHTWDVAKATGQDRTWDAAVLAPPLASMRFAVPAETRGGPVPFGPVVEVPADASEIDQLVAWYGRQP
jgi:uncharacterized protein (TIGR03086 family)